MKKFMIMGFLTLFFITSNIGFSEIDMEILDNSEYPQNTESGYMDFLYSNIKIKNDKLFFKQSFTLKKDVLIELIGDELAFPKNVTNNKKPVKVIKKNKIPHIFLKKGEHNIKGVITLNPNIKQIRVPSYVNIIELSLENEKNKLIKLNSPYLRIKTNNLLESVNDDELLDDIVDIANNIDLNLKKVMFHFTLDTF